MMYRRGAVAGMLALAGACAGDAIVLQHEGLRATITDRGYFELTVHQLPIVRQGQVYLADEHWRTVFPPRGGGVFTSETQRGDDGLSRAVIRTTAPEVTDAVMTFELSSTTFTFEMKQRIAAGNGIRHAVVDVFLDKAFCSGAEYAIDASGIAGSVSGTLDPADKASDRSNVSRLALSRQDVGRIEFTLSGSRPGTPKDASPWAFRNICDRPWGADDLKTFSLLNSWSSVPEQGGSHSVRFQVTLPNPERLRAGAFEHRLKRGVRLLHREVVAQERRLALPESPEPDTSGSLDEMMASQQVLAARYDSLRRTDGGLVIVPEPQQVNRRPGAYRCEETVIVKVGREAGRGVSRACEVIARHLEKKYRRGSRVERTDLPNHVIVIGESAVLPGDADLHAEGYQLQVGESGCCLRGRDDAGIFYAAQTFIQLLDPLRGDIFVPGIHIRDWPDMSWRGIHVWGFGSGATIEDVKRTITEVATRGKLNRFVFGTGYSGFHFARHPELRSRPGGITMDDMADLADLARAHFMEFIPAVQSFGHLNDLLRARPDLAEKEGANSYCPSNPDTYTLIFDLMDEIVEATKPKAMHIGHDEIQAIGSCPTCRDTPHHELYARDVRRIHDWLATRGCETMLWGDMLLDRNVWQDRGVHSANSNSQYGAKDTHLALDRLPKDVIICDWHYNDATTFPTLAHFRDHGFRVLACPWYRTKNNANFARAVGDAGTMGLLLTDWGFLSTLSAAGTNILGMDYAWTIDRPDPEALTYYPPEVLAGLLRPKRPSDAPGATFHPISLQAACNASSRASGKDDPSAWFGGGPMRDLSLLPRGRQTWQGIPFTLSSQPRDCIVVRAELESADTPSVTIERLAHSLLLMHTMQHPAPGVRHRPILAYDITYEDGETVTAQCRENRDIAHWETYARRENPWHWREGYADLYGAKCVWRGFTRDCTAINLQAYEWVNPRPDIPIDTVSPRLLGQTRDIHVALLAVTAVRK